MFRVRTLFSADSPFRYGKNVRVAPNVLTKKFGEDVLLFASSSRMNREALSLLADSKDSVRGRPKAFWEVFAKRANESVHLLPLSTLANIVRSLDMSPNVNLPIGTCKVISEYLSSQPTLEAVNLATSDIIVLFENLNKYLLEIDSRLFRNLLILVENSIHLVESVSDSERLLQETMSMGERVKDTHVQPLYSVVQDRLIRKKDSLSRLLK